MKKSISAFVVLVAVVCAFLLLHSRASRAPKPDVILTTPGYVGMPVATNGKMVTRLTRVVARDSNAPAQSIQTLNNVILRSVVARDTNVLAQSRQTPNNAILTTPGYAQGKDLTTSSSYGQSQSPTIVLTSKDVYTNSVRVFTSPTDTVHSLSFDYLDKSSADIEAIALAHRHPSAQIMKDGVVVAETVKGGSAGITHDRTNFAGLVLFFTNYDDAKLAEKALRGN